MPSSLSFPVKCWKKVRQKRFRERLKFSIAAEKSTFVNTNLTREKSITRKNNEKMAWWKVLADGV